MATPAPNWVRGSTAGLTPSRQLEVWREVSGSNYEVRFDGPDVGYPLDYVRFECGPLVVSHYKRGPALSVRTPQIVRRSDPGVFHVQVALAGNSAVNTDGAEAKGTNSGFLFMNMGRPIEVCSGEDTEIAAFFIDRDRMARLLPNASDLHGFVGGTTLTEIFKDHLLSLMRRAASITPDTAEPVVDAMSRLFVAALAPSPDALAAANVELNAGLLRRAKAYIQRELRSSELTPDRIARSIGVSRRKLYYLFEEEGGVARYVQCARLESARVALCDPGRAVRVKEAAFDHGFTSEAHFSRSFKRLFGFNASEAAEAVLFAAE
jgi:AraC-like DNA-binding protein